jgi:Uma2 family endonuclease
MPPKARPPCVLPNLRESGDYRAHREVPCIQFAALTAQEPASSMDDVLARVALQRRRFTVEEYHRMAETGILTADDRVELIEGEIVHKSPIGPRHALCIAELTGHFNIALAGRAVVWPQNSLRLPRDTEPLPDVVLLHTPPDRYHRRVPQPLDVMLLVEVADTSARYDRGVKLPLYARAGIPEVWIVDFTADVVEVYGEPGASGYAASQRVGRDGSVAPAAFPDTALSVDEILLEP